MFGESLLGWSSTADLRPTLKIDHASKNGLADGRGLEFFTLSEVPDPAVIRRLLTLRGRFSSGLRQVAQAFSGRLSLRLTDGAQSRSSDLGVRSDGPVCGRREPNPVGDCKFARPSRR